MHVLQYVHARDVRRSRASQTRKTTSPTLVMNDRAPAARPTACADSSAECYWSTREYECKRERHIVTATSTRRETNCTLARTCWSTYDCQHRLEGSQRRGWPWQEGHMHAHARPTSTRQARLRSRSRRRCSCSTGRACRLGGELPPHVCALYSLLWVPSRSPSRASSTVCAWSQTSCAPAAACARQSYLQSDGTWLPSRPSERSCPSGTCLPQKCME